MTTQSIPRTISRFGLFLFAFSIPVSHVPAQFAIGIAFFGWLGDGILNKHWSVRWHPLFWPLLAYLGWNLIASVASERPLHSLGALVDNEWPAMIMLMLFWIVDDETLLVRIIHVFLVASSAAIIYSLWQTVAGYEFYRGRHLDFMGYGFYRSVGFYGFYLTFAAFAMTVFFFASSFSLERKKWHTTLLSGLSFLAVLGTFARSMWLSFLAAIPLFAFTRGRKTGILVTITLLLIIGGGVLTVPALRYRVESIIEPGQNETRLNLWKTALRVAEHNPLLGVGEDNWDLVFERYRVEGFYDTTVHPHNDYLTVLVASGVPGLLMFLAMWWIAMVRGFKAALGSKSPGIRAAALGATFSLMGLLIGAMFQNYYGTFINCLGWWFVIGILLAAEKLGDRDLNILGRKGSITAL
jgi:putative inorganic carbon (hco3(-)) transporter